MSKNETLLSITGMTCGSCVRHVTRALQDVPGVSKVNVELRSGTASVEHTTAVQTASLAAAVEEAGYGAAPLASAKV